MSGEKSGRNTRNMTMTALMTVVICVCTWLCIPAPVPFTLQTFAVFAAAELLGGRLAFRAVAAYLVMGAAGLPVFSGMTGGIGVLLGPTGGYLWGFLLIPLAVRLAERFAGDRRTVRIIAQLLGLLACYGTGTAWFVLVSGGGYGWLTALTMCVAPFVLPDLVKLALAAALGRTLRRYIH